MSLRSGHFNRSRDQSPAVGSPKLSAARRRGWGWWNGVGSKRFELHNYEEAEFRFNNDKNDKNTKIKIAFDFFLCPGQRMSRKKQRIGRARFVFLYTFFIYMYIRTCNNAPGHKNITDGVKFKIFSRITTTLYLAGTDKRV